MTGIETIVAAASIASGAIGAVGAIQAGQAQARAAKFNAAALNQRAASERDAASAEAADFRRRERRQLAAARAARGTQGVTMAGSPLFVEEDTVREIALGAARIQHAGTVRGTRLEQDAQLERMRGRSARTSGFINAGSSLLGGVSNAFG